MNLIATLKTNWRDLVAGIGITIVVAFIADVVTNISIRQNGMVWLANVAAVLKGVSYFFAANLIAFLGVAVAWPTLNRWSNDSFRDGWAALNERDRLLVLIGVSCAYLLAAATCIG